MLPLNMGKLPWYHYALAGDIKGKNKGWLSSEADAVQIMLMKNCSNITTRFL